MYFVRNEIVQLKEESITEIYRLVNTSPKFFEIIHTYICLLKSRLLHERYDLVFPFSLSLTPVIFQPFEVNILP